MHDVLIQIANKLDNKGREDLADVVDQVIKSAAGRPKAPLKQLDDDVKKDLLKFLAIVQKNMKDSMEALEEFFRRLRYFDIDDVIKELGLDKTLKEMERTHDCMDNATKAMFALTHGKRPSKDDIDQLADDFGLNEKNKLNPLDFFEQQRPDEFQHPITEEEAEEGLEESLYNEQSEDVPYYDISDKDLEEFWSYEDSKDEKRYEDRE